MAKTIGILLALAIVFSALIALSSSNRASCAAKDGRVIENALGFFSGCLLPKGQ